MRKNGTFELIFGLVAIILLSVLGVFLCMKFLGFLKEIDKSLAAAIIAALISVLTLVFTYWKDKEKTRQEAHREKKVEVYSLFSNLVFDVLKGSKTEGGVEKILKEKRFMDTMYSLMEGILFYGSPKVIVSYSKFKNISHDNEQADPMYTLKIIGDILLAMRADLGLSNRGLNNLNIHKIYVNDLDAN